jgi:hypothetical protein
MDCVFVVGESTNFGSIAEAPPTVDTPVVLADLLDLGSGTVVVVFAVVVVFLGGDFLSLSLTTASSDPTGANNEREPEK